MKATVISLLFFLFLLPFCSALDFSFTSPESVNLNESFQVVISATTPDNYDVKIVVMDNATKATLSEIYNDEWKNPFYYIKSAFPAKSEFSVRVIKYSDKSQICTKLRKTGSSSYSEKCSPIEIKQSDAQEQESPPEEEDKVNSTSNEIKPNKTVQKEAPDFTPASSPPSTYSSPEVEKTEPVINGSNDKIILTPKTASAESFITKDEKIRLYAVYGFTFFSICIIILLALRKI